MAEMFTSRRIGADGSPRPLSKRATVDRIMEMSKKSGGPFRMKEAEQERWSPKRTLGELRTRLPDRIDQLQLGDVLWVDNAKEWDDTVTVRQVLMPAPDLELPNCTEPCESIIADLRHAFPNHLNLGWYNCRRIAGSSSWSQHAWGNAYDAGGSLAQVKAMAAHVIAQARAGSLPVAEVIFNRQKWMPETGVRPYTGSDPHTSHMHVTARPYRTGTPPCA